MKTALVVGAGGLMGRSIVRELLSTGVEVLTTGRGSEYDYFLDLSFSGSIYLPTVDVVFLCAYHTNVDECERDSSTWTPNVSNQMHLIDWAEGNGVRIVFPSSSYVFGKASVDMGAWFEQDKPSPLNVYGVQKYAIEQRLLSSSHNHLVLRTVAPFGEDDPKQINYPYQIYRSLVMEAPIDQFVNPLHIDDFSSIAVDLANKSQSGIFHIAGDTEITKHSFNHMVAEAFGAAGVAVPFANPRKSFDLHRSARRPRQGSLATFKIVRYGYKVPSLQKGVEQFVKGVLKIEDERVHLSSKTGNRPG